MKKLTAFVVTLFLTASFAWSQAASPTPISKVALNPQPLPPGAGKTAAITVRKAGERQQELNAQPLPPGKKVELNPQPLPPKVNNKSAVTTGPNGNLNPGAKVGFNPQPDPPAVQKHMNASTTKLF